MSQNSIKFSVNVRKYAFMYQKYYRVRAPRPQMSIRCLLPLTMYLACNTCEAQTPSVHCDSNEV